jgi:hypothetical protein
MAIQLNDRDHLIFKLIEEHQVLLEKHISWFISNDDKPVLIRDRLRKLFYLDYLLCERHPSRLPWWTTPTKPLVYMLSSMTKDAVGYKQDASVLDPEMQRHYLEVANLRMLFLQSQKDGQLSDFTWTTLKDSASDCLDAIVSFRNQGESYRIGMLNHPDWAEKELVAELNAMVERDNLDMIWVVSRDQAHQEMLQRHLSFLAGSQSSLYRKLAFATHQEFYKEGVSNSRWTGCDGRPATIWKPSVMPGIPMGATQAFA